MSAHIDKLIDQAHADHLEHDHKGEKYECNKDCVQQSKLRLYELMRKEREREGVSDRDNARRDVAFQKEQQKSPELGASSRDRQRTSRWSRLLSLFGLRRKVPPSQVAAGLLALATPDAGLDQKALTELEPKVTDVPHIRDELGHLRIFAALHATRNIESKQEIHDIFWLFFGELTPRPLSKDGLAAFKKNQGDYDTLAFMGVPDGKELLWEVGKVFAQRIGRPMDPIAAAAGAFHLAGAYKVASDFVRSVRVVATMRESSSVTRLRARQQMRWM